MKSARELLTMLTERGKLSGGEPAIVSVGAVAYIQADARREPLDILVTLLSLIGSCLKWDATPEVPYATGEEATLRQSYCETMAKAACLLKKRIADAPEQTEPPPLKVVERMRGARTTQPKM